MESAKILGLAERFRGVLSVWMFRAQSVVLSRVHCFLNVAQPGLGLPRHEIELPLEDARSSLLRRGWRLLRN